MKNYLGIALLLICGWQNRGACEFGDDGLARVPYNHPGLVVDLGVGLWAWPLPMDYDQDGDYDLVVSCKDVPYNGIYFFENPGGDSKLPVFKAGVRIADGVGNIQISYVDGQPRVLAPRVEYQDFRSQQLSQPRQLPFESANIHPNRVRANQWKYADFDGDDRLDLLIGVGDWVEYGWDDAFDEQGNWTRGPLHGFVYLVRNVGTTAQPRYETPVKLTAQGQPIDVYGMPSPNLADFDSDGDLDLICGEFVDSFTYFENVGSRRQPEFAAGRKLMLDDAPLRVDLCMHVDVALDWDRDGDVDLVVGQEDGRVMFIEHTGQVSDGTPVFAAPKFFQQQAADLKFGALVTPVSCDWDADGDEDLICGNTAGRIGFIENLDGGCPPRWAAPRRLAADGREIHIQAGPNGSIQGPCEAKWGYTTLSVADWDQDGLPDLVVNSIWGKVIWFRNIGERTAPRLAPAQAVEVDWPGQPPRPSWFWWRPEGKQLVTQWRTTPVVIDYDQDGLNDLVMLDTEGYLAFFRRERTQEGLRLLPGVRRFEFAPGQPMRLNERSAGGSGRRKLCFADWNGDGSQDLLANGPNVDLFEATGNSLFQFLKPKRLDERRLAGHTTSPTVVDWDQNGIPDLLAGAEDGYFYYLKNPRAKNP
jgi:hypothetical protein